MAGRFRDFTSRGWDANVPNPEPTPTENTEEAQPASGPRSFGVTNADGVLKSEVAKIAEASGTTEEEVNKETRARATTRATKPKTVTVEDDYLASERQRLANARSEREYRAIEREVNAARDQRRKAASSVESGSSETEQKSPQQIRDEARAVKARQRAEEKVNTIWQENGSKLTSDKPSKAQLEAESVDHPLASAGANELMDAASKMHATMASYIRNPGTHILRSAGIARAVADKMDRVIPNHPYAVQLRKWADDISSPESISNFAKKLGGGRGSANDTLVDVEAAMHDAKKVASQNSEMLVAGEGTARPVFTVASPSQQKHSKIATLFNKLGTLHNKIQSTLPDGIVHPNDHVAITAAVTRAKTLADGSGDSLRDSEPDYDPVTGAWSQPNHIWDHTDRYRLGSEAGTAKQIEVTKENHELLKKRGIPSLVSVMGAKLAERRGGATRGERGTTAKIALSPTTVTVRDVSSQEGSVPYRAIDVRRLPEHHRAYHDTQGRYYHPQNLTRYRQGDLGTDNKPVKLSLTRYWKPVQE